MLILLIIIMIIALVLFYYFGKGDNGIGGRPIEDPGGEGLLRKAKEENVENHSQVIVKPDTACMVCANGDAVEIIKPGKTRIKTGVWPIFRKWQEKFSQGRTVYTSEFFYYDTDPSVYRNFEFTVDNLLCRDIETRLMIKCNPVVNVAVGIEDPFKYYTCLKGFGLNDRALESFLDKKSTPKVKSELFNNSKTQPMIDLNANAMNFTNALNIIIENMLKDMGLRVDRVQVFDIGVDPESLDRLANFYGVVSENELIQKIAIDTCNGDLDKAREFYLKLKTISEKADIAQLGLVKMF